MPPETGENTFSNLCEDLFLKKIQLLHGLLPNALGGRNSLTPKGYENTLPCAFRSGKLLGLQAKLPNLYGLAALFLYPV